MVEHIKPEGLKEFTPPAHDFVVNKQLVGKHIGSTKMTVTLGRMAPGGDTAQHKHDEEQCHYVLSGEITITSPEGNFVVKPGECSWYAPGQLHGMKNESKNDCVYLVITAPSPGW